jgi:hypothetical protein
MYFCILVLPFLSVISCLLLGRFIGVSGSCFLSTSAIACAFFLSLFAFFETAVFGSMCNIHLGT